MRALAPLRLLCLVLLGTRATPAAAQPRDDDDLEYQPGITAANQGRVAEALAIFQAIYTRTHSPRALARMGVTEIQLGYWLAAEEHLAASLSSTGDRWIQQNRRRVEEARERAAAHIAQIEVVCAAPAASLRVNGLADLHFVSPHTIRVLRGEVLIEVNAPGYLPYRRSVTVDAPNVQIPVRLQPELRRAAMSRPAPLLRPDQRAGSGPWLTVAWVSGGLAVTSLALTAIVGIMAEQRYNGLLRECAPRCRADDVADIELRENLVNVGFWMTVGFGATAIASGILHRTGRTNVGVTHAAVSVRPGGLLLQIGGSL